MYKPVDKDYVLRLVQMKGPVIPMSLKKDLQTDSLLISAVLGQLVDEGKLRVTKVKIGGSPNYYVPGSEERLVPLMKYLNEKDRRTAEILQEKKVLKDTDQDPLVRVCLRNIPDYAKPLEVNVKGEKQVYWKWFLVPAKEAEEEILKSLKPLEAPKPAPAPKAASTPQDTPVKKAVAMEKRVQAPPNQIVKSSQAAVDKPKETLTRESQKKIIAKPETQTHLTHTPDDAKSKEQLDSEKDSFFQDVRRYLEKSGIAIKDYKKHRKTEIDLFVFVPTQIGSQEYYCKAKSKKKINDGDLSSAYIQGQNTKLPIIFLTPGELTKKAEGMLKSEFKGMTVKRI
ncbi:hypothetical protein JW711_01785 [Candidatus Woesearchaeota archaeon]|nr:hypothetical protein [Candidatus Woesearchaeota archaeon]